MVPCVDVAEGQGGVQVSACSVGNNNYVCLLYFWTIRTGDTMTDILKRYNEVKGAFGEMSDVAAALLVVAEVMQDFNEDEPSNPLEATVKQVLEPEEHRVKCECGNDAIYIRHGEGRCEDH